MASRQQAGNEMRRKALKRKMNKDKEVFGNPYAYDKKYVYVLDAMNVEKAIKAKIAKKANKSKRTVIINIVCPQCERKKRKPKAIWNKKWEAFICEKCKKKWEMLEEDKVKNFLTKIERTNIKKEKTPEPFDDELFNHRYGFLNDLQRELDQKRKNKNLYKHRQGNYKCPVKECERHKKPFQEYEDYLNHYLDKHAKEAVKDRYRKRQKQYIKTEMMTDYRIEKRNGNVVYIQVKKKDTEGRFICKDKDGNDCDVCQIHGCLKMIKVKKDGSVDQEKWDKHMEEHRREIFHNRKEMNIYCPICKQKTTWDEQWKTHKCRKCKKDFEETERDYIYVYVFDIISKQKYVARLAVNEMKRKRMMAKGHYKQEKRGVSKKNYTDVETLNAQIKAAKRYKGRTVITEVMYIE
jgi:transposase-like protein